LLFFSKQFIASYFRYVFEAALARSPAKLQMMRVKPFPEAREREKQQSTLPSPVLEKETGIVNQERQEG
jgi:hypothetical protein